MELSERKEPLISFRSIKATVVSMVAALAPIFGAPGLAAQAAPTTTGQGTVQAQPSDVAIQPGCEFYRYYVDSE